MERLNHNTIFFPALDGLRFIAFFVVLILHAFSPAYNFLEVSNSFVNVLFHFCTNGKSAVSLFFVLSGFLITYFLIKEKLTTGRIHIGLFYVRRVLRLWPLYYLLMLVVIVFFPLLREAVGLGGKTYDSISIYYLFFLGNFDVLNIYKIHGQVFMPLGITWSVAVEEQFYLFWPLLLAIVKPRMVGWIMLVVLIVSLLFRIAYRNDEIVLYFSSLSQFADMAVGGLAAYFVLTHDGFRLFFQTLSSRRRNAIYLFGFCFLLMNSWLNYHRIPYFITFYRLPETLFFAFIILDQSFNQSLSGKLSNYKFISRWGKYTYGLYLLHPLALYFFDALFFKITGFSNKEFLPLFAMGVLAVPLTFALAYLSYHFVEQKFLRLKDNFRFDSKGHAN